MAAPESPVIDTNGLVRRFGRTDAVNGLSLRVQPGRCYGFFGRNGAGKTTTIKCLLNLLRPTAGTVRVFGLDPAKEDVAVKSRLVWAPQLGMQLPVTSVLLYFAAGNHRSHDAPPVFRQAALLALIAFAGLTLATLALGLLYGTWMFRR
jgi:ABC-type multidrug transport system ATPase subunit